MKVNKYLPFALVYFFGNAAGLPFGLTWMSLLAPFLYYWILLKRKKEVLLPFLAILLPFVAIHLSSLETDSAVYLVSLLNLVMVYIFGQAFYTWLLQKPDLRKLYRQLLVLNFILCLLGLVIYFTPWVEFMWIRQQLTKGVDDFYRLKMFTYEASHYASLFVPLFFYFLLAWLLRTQRFPQWLLFPMLLLPLLLSFSMGVIASLLISFSLLLLIHFRSLIVKRRVFNLLLNTGLALTICALVLVLFFRDSPLFTRLLNIFSGEDTSANGRTIEAFYLARNMIGDDHLLWGIGLGQIKLQGHDLIQGYYLYNMDFVATLPNSMAEILAIFGWIGLILKIMIELFFFVSTRVWNDHFRLALFCYMFIYQFTGSYITNMAEYVIWILAFTPVFPEFERKPRTAPLMNSLPPFASLPHSHL